MIGRIAYTDLLLEMLSIPAVSREENKRADFLESYLKGMGWPLTRIHNNLLVGDRDAPGAPVLLNSHMDTVSPADTWESDPYTPLVKGEKIVGLGSNDAGASVVSMLAAFDCMREELKDRINLMVLISAEEEVSGSNGISSMLPMLGNLEAVIVGEPTGMAPAVAERGLMVLDGKVWGKAGHAARKEGLNAIYEAMKDLKAIGQLEFTELSEWLPAPGAQVTMISAGSHHNVVPDLCRYVVDVRSNDRYGNERLLGMIRSVCSAELTPRSTRLHSSGLDDDHFLMKAIQAAGFEPFGSSTLSDMALIPFPAVKMGPGESSRSHTAGEYILKSELEQGVADYCRFLKHIEILEKRSQ
ncbi:MAG: M20/M25/M40 family metallo-hydrolase [Bacteroidales bacterium]|nr:M20/M25/M40 family metallo-hydrolase [Bacteroidales bacterium]